ncbi:MAG: RimK family alpha-L-glutamate ligase [Methanomicrobiales archaeon]|nr:RimK family alpha-L-glutamate ligase [Methanomicrobiales archaeon]
MSNLGVFVDRQTLGNAEQLTALLKLRDTAERMGHTLSFIFPVDIKRIGRLDGLFIRSRTDPMNISFVAAKMAEFHGIPVIDDPDSIQICSDKINMYLHLMKNGVPLPETLFLRKDEITTGRLKEVFETLGTPLVVKEPSTSFSARVEKVDTVSEFMRVAKRFIKLSDWIVAQSYVESQFDWRVGVLHGEVLYACKYIIPTESFKIQATVNGHVVYCAVKSVPHGEVPPRIVDTALQAADAIGTGLYGVDIKEKDEQVYVIEVNDNPSLEGGEDEYYPRIYEQIISYLLRE